MLLAFRVCAKVELTRVQKSDYGVEHGVADVLDFDLLDLAFFHAISKHCSKLFRQ